MLDTAKGISTTVPWCFGAEHQDWQRTLRTFATQVVAPAAAQHSIDGTFHAELVPPLAELGVFGLRVSEEHGGSDGDITSLCIALEELARVDSSTAATVHTQGVTAALFDHLATDEQKRDILPAAVRGELFISFGLTEPSGGSDAGNIRTTARRDGGDWVVNGAKQFITNPGTPYSKYVILFAATGEGRKPGRPAVSAFLVPLDAPGVTVAPGYHKLGWRGSDTRPLFFEDVRLPDEALLHEEGRGYARAVEFLVWTRMPIAAIGTGLAQACLDETLSFVADRQSFGKPLSQHQAVAFDLADMAAKVAVARLVTYDACYKYDHDLPFATEGAIAKYVSSELANRVSYRATQLHGGYGFIDESAVTRHYRDARLLTIGEGTSEVQKLLIARALGL